MSTCYKCNREIPCGVECDPECQPEFRPIMTSDEIAEQMDDYEKHAVAVDWDAVKTLEDLKQIVRALVGIDSVQRGSALYHELRKFLKEKNPHD